MQSLRSEWITKKGKRCDNMPSASQISECSYIFCSNTAGVTWRTLAKAKTMPAFSWKIVFTKVLADDSLISGIRVVLVPICLNQEFLNFWAVFIFITYLWVPESLVLHLPGCTYMLECTLRLRAHSGPNSWDWLRFDWLQIWLLKVQCYVYYIFRCLFFIQDCCEGALHD